MVLRANTEKLDREPQPIKGFIARLDQLVGQVLYIREDLARFRVKARTTQRSGNLGEISTSQCRALAGGKSALDFIELLILPAPERGHFRRFVKDNTDTIAVRNIPPARAGNPAIHRRLEDAKDVVHRHVEVVGAGRAAHLRELVGNDPHFGISCPVAAGFFREIGQSFDIEDWADYRIEKPIEPHGFVDSQGLQKRFVEKRYD